MCVFMYVSNIHEVEKHIVFATMQSHTNMACGNCPSTEADRSARGLTSGEMEFSEPSALGPASTHTIVHLVIVLECRLMSWRKETRMEGSIIANKQTGWRTACVPATWCSIMERDATPADTTRQSRAGNTVSITALCQGECRRATAPASGAPLSPHN